MVNIIKQNEKELYQCQECGLHYEHEEQAEKCYEWCNKNKSCNLNIIFDAVEDKTKK